MAIYVYNGTTGALYSWTPNDTDQVASPSDLAAQGLMSVSGLPPLDSTHSWDAATKTVVTVSAPTPPNNILTWQFVLLFTPAEHSAIAASTDPKVTQFMMAVQTAQKINLNDPVVQNGINYLVSVNLLTSANATLILSGKPSQ